MSFDRLIRFIQDGEAVSAGVTNRAPRVNDRNIRYLWDLLRAAEIGSTVFLRDATVEAESRVGMAVYLNGDTQRFERGLAQLESVPGTARLRTAASAQIWGIVHTKSLDTKADLLLHGFSPLAIGAALGLSADATVPAGTYYLSGTTPGRLTTQQPPISVMVLRADGHGNVLVNPQFVDFVDRHQHYKVELTCAPAGTVSPPLVGGRHTISDADDSAQGWLPADHAVFGGHAPTGAVFGYNLSAHATLSDLWPPLPVSSATLEFDRGEDTRGYSSVPLGADGLCILDRYGIWWLSDCYGDVPWPTLLDNTGSASDSASDSSSGSPECPRTLSMRMLLWFAKAQFATNDTVVTSLKSKSGRLAVTVEDTTTVASAGALDIDLDLTDFVDSGTEEPGYLVLKTLDDTTFKRGPVVSGLYAAGDNLTLTGEAEVPVDPDDPDGATMQVGAVEVRVDAYPTRELEVQSLRFSGGAEDDVYDDTLFVSLPAGQASSYRAKLHVPADIVGETIRLRLRFILLGTTAGTLPQLTVTARRLPRPSDGLDAPENLPDSDDEFSFTVATNAVLTSAYQYAEAVSTAHHGGIAGDATVAAGDVVFFTVSRDDDDGYAGDVGVVHQVGVLSVSDDLLL